MTISEPFRPRRNSTAIDRHRTRPIRGMDGMGNHIIARLCDPKFGLDDEAKADVLSKDRALPPFPKLTNR